MSQPLGVDDFFILEAGEYLDRLAALAGGGSAPGADELVRFTRALRGSALMANQQPIARAANALEHVVRAYRDGRRSWDRDLAVTVHEAVDMLRTLVERVRNWAPEDAARAERLASQLEAAAGGAPASAQPPTGATETGVRAFLAREAAALASVLDQAARSVMPSGVAPDTLQAVLRRMQPLDGLAALSDFPPLPDVLAGIEHTVQSLSRLELPPPAGGARFEASARALARAARDIADRGRPDGEAEEFRLLAELLLSDQDQGPPVVPVESLFYPGESGIVQRGVVPRGTVAASLGAAAIVSRGEHLCQAAAEIAEAQSSTQRDLRLHALLVDLRTLATGLPAGLDVAVETFSVSARAAVSRGAAAREAARFAGLIRDAGSRLRGFTEVTQSGTLVGAFEALVAEVDGLGPLTDLPVPPPVVAAAPAHDEGDVVPIEALAPDEPAAAPSQPVAEPVPVAVGGDGWDLAASYAEYERLVAGATVAPVQPEARAPAAAAVEQPLVEIEALLYRGRAALERAGMVQREIRSALTHKTPQAVQPLVDELLDLVALALAD